ncbi:MAG: sulfotransferase [Gammaproteobacteria bacterium]
MSAAKCIVILSEKSSGSSACQNILAKFADIRHVAKTRHYENETLYWTKAASVLGLPQLDMIDSEVPIDAPQARTELIALLQENLDEYEPPGNDRELICDGWRKLCRQHAPIFLEKSPHHLCQWSALELMHSCMQQIEDIDFLFVGLIRNPMDTLYSQFQRWRTRPEDLQYQWLTAYRNLLCFKQLVGDRLVIVRYEDLVVSLHALQPVFDFCQVAAAEADCHYLHRQSLLKWQTDTRFGFQLDPDIVELAKQYGYPEEHLRNCSRLFWPLYREIRRSAYRIALAMLQGLPPAAVKRIKALLKR